jgi:hypothetical protein
LNIVAGYHMARRLFGGRYDPSGRADAVPSVLAMLTDRFLPLGILRLPRLE